MKCSRRWRPPFYGTHSGNVLGSICVLLVVAVCVHLAWRPVPAIGP